MKYLALGDSYTIGEAVAEQDNFPHQLADLLRKDGFDSLEPPKVIAKTGWTSEELNREVQSLLPELTNDYDFVTLLVGVNDQYRGLSLEDYVRSFLTLLLRAIVLANSRSQRVYVLSVPDWGVTPFAEKEGRDKEQVAKEIHDFNNRNKALAIAYRCHYLDITPLSRHQGEDEQYLTKDQLHYSAEAYNQWAVRLAKLIKETLPKKG